jgi:hypothetical protein
VPAPQAAWQAKVKQMKAGSYTQKPKGAERTGGGTAGS